MVNVTVPQEVTLFLVNQMKTHTDTITSLLPQLTGEYSNLLVVAKGAATTALNTRHPDDLNQIIAVLHRAESLQAGATEVVAQQMATADLGASQVLAGGGGSF